MKLYFVILSKPPIQDIFNYSVVDEAMFDSLLKRKIVVNASEWENENPTKEELEAERDRLVDNLESSEALSLNKLLKYA